jgi:hypothetical protein
MARAAVVARKTARKRHRHGAAKKPAAVVV